MSLVSNVSVLKSEWFQKLNEGFWQVLAELAATSTGTFYQVKGKDGRSLIVLVTDLTSQLFVIAQTSTMKIERLGQTSITIAAANISKFTNVVLSPALPEAITNYLVFTSADGNFGSEVSCAGKLNSTVQIAISATRPGYSAGTPTGATATGLTVAGNDLSDVNTVVSNPHGSDVGVGPHAHTVTGHPVTEAAHTHTVPPPVISGAGQGAQTVLVDWMIVHV